MQKHILKIRDIEAITHNVKRFALEKPTGIRFTPGQATELSINQSGFESRAQPFTFTAPEPTDHLEFIIKIYKGHDGVTEKLDQLVAGDELILHDVFGTISYKGPGLFIAAGTGITPFICIFRDLKAKGGLKGNSLLFANRTEEDIILKDELISMPGLNYENVIGKHIDRATLEPFIEKDRFYYICGPDPFVAQMMDYLRELGVPVSQIVVEQD